MILLEGLSENENIKVLDISYNGFGQENPTCATKLGEYIKQNKTLVHLDASANFFKKDQCKFISDVKIVFYRWNSVSKVIEQYMAFILVVIMVTSMLEGF